MIVKEIANGTRSLNVCDKCGRTVAHENDANAFDAHLGQGLALLSSIHRHLLPVIEDGVAVCEGSPSRAQYLEGQMRDKRTSYHYQQEYEERFRAAYDEMHLESLAQKSHLQ